MKAVSISWSKWPMLQTTAPGFSAASMWRSQTAMLPVAVTSTSTAPSSSRFTQSGRPVLMPSMYGETSS